MMASQLYLAGSTGWLMAVLCNLKRHLIYDKMKEDDVLNSELRKLVTLLAFGSFPPAGYISILSRHHALFSFIISFYMYALFFIIICVDSR